MLQTAFPVHSKVYCWMKGDALMEAWLGSANHTMTGVGRVQPESMAKTNPEYAENLYQRAEGVEDRVIFRESRLPLLSASRKQWGQESVTMSFLVKGKYSGKARHQPSQNATSLPLIKSHVS